MSSPPTRESAFQCSDDVYDIKICGDSILCGLRNGTIEIWNKGPYLNDVYPIFGILDPRPPCLHFGKIHSTKSTQPPLLRLHFVNPPSPLSVDVI